MKCDFNVVTIIFVQSLFKMNSVSLDNFSVYLENLSPYYVTCVLLSFIAVLLTWWYLEQDPTNNEGSETETVDEVDESTAEGTTSFLTEMKVARQQAFDKELTAGMSDEQLQQEKDAEKEQLAAIFDLLREQEDKFQVDSMEDLQSQMRLYRR